MLLLDVNRLPLSTSHYRHCWEIHRWAFKGCTSLIAAYFQNSLQSIGVWAVYNYCYLLISAELPPTLQFDGLLWVSLLSYRVH